MQGYYLLANAQPYARTVCFGSEEWHKYAIQHLRHNTLAIVGNGNDKVALVA